MGYSSNKHTYEEYAEYRKNNLERLRQNEQKYAEANREACKKRTREWTKKNRERSRQNSKEYYQKNKEKWPSFPSYWNGLTFILRKESPWLLKDPCCYCGEPMRDIDHIVPRSKDGDNTWENLTAACETCNKKKQNKSLLEFMLESEEKK